MTEIFQEIIKNHLGFDMSKNINIEMSKNVCNGICSDRKKFNKAEIELIKKELPAQRIMIVARLGTVNHNEMTMAGLRFKDDEDVISTMETAAEKAKNLSLEQFIQSALYDCMGRDYYYMFEKDYGGNDE